MRLIDADTLKAEFTGNFHELWHYTGVKAIVDVAPTVDAVPVVHGQWVDNSTGEWYVCSECRQPAMCYRDRENGDVYESWLSSYCPNCGARMDGVNNE